MQNLDLMNLAGFCRNCLSNWMKDAADARGVPMSKDESRETIYGMPYEEWKAKHQKEASKDQQAAFEKAAPQALILNFVSLCTPGMTGSRLDLRACASETSSDHSFESLEEVSMATAAAAKEEEQPATRFAKDHLKAFVERVERLEEEKKTIADDIRDVYAEAKANGFDVKALRAIVRLRKQDADERREQEAILETYMHALGMLN